MGRVSLATSAHRRFAPIARHANATRVDVKLFLHHGSIVLEVTDDGVGVGTLTPHSSLGLLGMRERARRLDGTCEVRSHNGRGTSVVLSVPLRFPRRDIQLADDVRHA